MYFWNIEQLKADFIAGNVTEKNQLKYLVAYIILISLTMVPTSTSEINLFDILSGLTLIPVSVMGILYAYSKNGGDSGSNFLAKYFAIGWIMTVKIAALTLILMIALIIFVVVLGFNFSEESTMWSVLISVTFTSLYFWLIAVHIGHTVTVND